MLGLATDSGGVELNSVAVAIVCKTPEVGKSKTRLSPPLEPDECAGLSACFISDLSETISELTRDGDATGYALYTPAGSAPKLRPLLPPSFELHPQFEGDFGERLAHGATDLLQRHGGVLLVNSDSPTLPRSILRAAVDAVKEGDGVVLSPAYDGGYTLIGLSRMHSRLFQDVPWSTPEVFSITQVRAREIGLPVIAVPGWYDVDDAHSLQLLEEELAGHQLPFAATPGAHAPATRHFLNTRRAMFPTA